MITGPVRKGYRRIRVWTIVEAPASMTDGQILEVMNDQPNPGGYYENHDPRCEVQATKYSKMPSRKPPKT